jgi:hypothetical protein
LYERRLVGFPLKYSHPIILINYLILNMKFFKIIPLCLVILLHPSLVSSQETCIKEWLKLDENTVYYFLRTRSDGDVSKQVHSQGINMYVSNKSYVKSNLIIIESWMVSFDSGIPVQFGESMWIKDKLNRKGQSDQSSLLKTTLFRNGKQENIQKYTDNNSFEIIKDDYYEFQFKVKEKSCQQIPHNLKYESKVYNDGEYLIFHHSGTWTRDIKNIRKEFLFGKLDVSDLNMYDIHNLIDVFIKEMKYFSNKYLSENFESSYQNSSKVDSFIKMVENSDINVDFDLKVSGVLGISKSMNDDSKISISINPILWKNSSDSKRLYIIYHELGHDILNFKHGEGGKMMFPISENEYNYNEFYNDREYMFNRFFKNLFTQ